MDSPVTRNWVRVFKYINWFFWVKRAAGQKKFTKNTRSSNLFCLFVMFYCCFFSFVHRTYRKNSRNATIFGTYLQTISHCDENKKGPKINLIKWLGKYLQGIIEDVTTCRVKPFKPGLTTLVSDGAYSFETWNPPFFF